MNHLIYLIMDSCRYDSCSMADTPNIERLGTVERRFSYASWTSPSHYAMLMGMMPHNSPCGVFASEVYKGEFKKWVERLDIEGLSFKTFVPELSLPKILKDYGYRTIARVSLPVLNPHAGLSRFFDDYRLMDNHNDFAGMVREISFPDQQPRFYFLNLGETHYPYMLAGADLPHISGVHGVLKSLRDSTPDPASSGDRFFPIEEMQRLHQQQVRCVEYVDSLIGELYRKCPANTYFVITAGRFGRKGWSASTHQAAPILQQPSQQGLSDFGAFHQPLQDRYLAERVIARAEPHTAVTFVTRHEFRLLDIPLSFQATTVTFHHASPLPSQGLVQKIHKPFAV